MGWEIAPLDQALYCEEIEQRLLGALLINNRAYAAVEEFLTPQHFGNALHGRIFAAIARLVDRGESANPVTLRALFDQDQSLADSGGGKYLARLAGSAVTILNSADYGRAVLDRSRRRMLVAACNDAVADAGTIDLARPAEKIIEEHERRLGEAAEGGRRAGWVSIGEASRAAIDEIEQAYQRGAGLAGVTTGLADLDARLGGLLAGDLVVLAARPSMGKTALALGIARAAARSGTPVAFFELEQTAPQLAARALAGMTGIPLARQRRGDLTASDWPALVAAGNEIATEAVHIDDTSSPTVAQIRQRARRMQRRHKIGLVVIDHLQLIAGSSVRTEGRRLEIEAITGALKALAKELSAPVLLLSQLSRALESRDDKRPILADLRESGSIEQDADRVVFIYRASYYLDQQEPAAKAGETEDALTRRYEVWEERCRQASGIAELIVAKDRHGAPGTVKVHWDPARVSFGNLRWGTAL